MTLAFDKTREEIFPSLIDILCPLPGLAVQNSTPLISASGAIAIGNPVSQASTEHDERGRYPPVSSRYLELTPILWNARVKMQEHASDIESEDALDANPLHPSG